jgi:ankyrin repeat protein
MLLCSVMRTLCGYGSLDLFPGTINTRFPGLDNYSQLHIAMRRGDLRAMLLLLAGGADVDALDSYGNSPLMYWPVAPAEPEELVLDLAGALLAHVGDGSVSIGN